MRKKRIEKVMLSVVERLIECLERETADLSGGGMNATRTHIATKSRLLFDLNRAVRETGGDTLTPAVVERLAVLRGALDRNASAIRVHSPRLTRGTDARCRQQSSHPRRHGQSGRIAVTSAPRRRTSSSI